MLLQPLLGWCDGITTDNDLSLTDHLSEVHLKGTRLCTATSSVSRFFRRGFACAPPSAIKAAVRHQQQGSQARESVCQPALLLDGNGCCSHSLMVSTCVVCVGCRLQRYLMPCNHSNVTWVLLRWAATS